MHYAGPGLGLLGQLFGAVFAALLFLLIAAIVVVLVIVIVRFLLAATRAAETYVRVHEVEKKGAVPPTA